MTCAVFSTDIYEGLWQGTVGGKALWACTPTLNAHLVENSIPSSIHVELA